jgi:hypothetical protein
MSFGKATSGQSARGVNTPVKTGQAGAVFATKPNMTLLLLR